MNRPRAEVLTSGAIALNAALALIAQIALASAVGPGRALDVFFAATAVPLSLVTIGGTALGLVVIPAIADRAARGEDVATFERRVLGQLLALAVLAGTVGALGGTVSALRVGGHAADGALALATLAAPLWVLSVAALVAQFLVPFHHVRSRFVRPAFVTALFPLSLAAGATVLYGRLGIPALVGAYAAAAVLQVVLLAAPLAHVMRPLADGSVSDLIVLVGSAVPVTMSFLFNTLAPVSDALWSASLPAGSLSYVTVTSRLTVAVGGILTTGMASVAYPTIAAAASRGDMDVVRARLRDLVVRGALVLIPAAAVLVAVRRPLVGALLEHGAFGRGDSAAVGMLLVYYGSSMVFFGCSNLVIRAAFAVGEGKRAAAVGVAAVIGYVALSGALSHTRGFVGIAEAFLITWMLTLIAQLALLVRRVGPFLSRTDARVIAAATLAVFAASFVVG